MPVHNCGEINHMVKNLTYGHWDVFYMKYVLSDPLSWETH